MGFVIGCVGMIVASLLYAFFQFLQIKISHSKKEILDCDLKLIELRRQEIQREEELIKSKRKLLELRLQERGGKIK